jgi:hypothetical protein
MVRKFAILMVCACPVLAAAQPDVVPQGWFKAGSMPQDYEVGTDRAVRRSGGASAYVRARVAAPRGFGTVMQAFAADEFRGKRVRLAGYLRTAGVRKWAGLWMRVDGPERRSPLAFDNMQDRALSGTTEWTRGEIVLDVPPEAVTINFGLLLEGEGQVWVDDIEIIAVGREVPTTGHGPRLPSRPRNLDFERKPPPTMSPLMKEPHGR